MGKQGRATWEAIFLPSPTGYWDSSCWLQTQPVWIRGFVRKQKEVSQVIIAIPKPQTISVTLSHNCLCHSPLLMEPGQPQRLGTIAPTSASFLGIHLHSV